MKKQAIIRLSLTEHLIKEKTDDSIKTWYSVTMLQACLHSSAQMSTPANWKLAESFQSLAITSIATSCPSQRRKQRAYLRHPVESSASLIPFQTEQEVMVEEGEGWLGTINCISLCTEGMKIILTSLISASTHVLMLGFSSVFFQGSQGSVDGPFCPPFILTTIL